MEILSLKAAGFRHREIAKAAGVSRSTIQRLLKAAELQIELLFLPSYSPNLNVIERLWKFVKKEVLNSRHLGNFHHFQNAIQSCLDSLSGSRRSAITQMLTLRFQRLDQVALLSDSMATNVTGKLKDYTDNE
jgi:transcriptional regulator with XRE-family HTH domain